QPVEGLQISKIGLATLAVARRHLSIIVDHAARVDELIVAADEGKQLTAVLLKLVERPERVSYIGDVLRAVLSDLWVLLKRHRLPVEASVVLVPFELDHAQEEWCRPIENVEGGAAIEAEPDLVSLLVARPVPDLVDSLRLGGRQAVLRRRAGGAAN